jgi:hypothetical protein
MDHLHEFHSPKKQQEILARGTREALIEWLMWHDPNGIWSDADSLLEGKPPISWEQAQQAMLRFLADN